MPKQAENTRPAHAQRMKQPAQKRRFISSAEILLVRKDMGDIWAKNSQRVLLMLLPLTLAVGLPVVYFAAISLLPVEAGAKMPQALLNLLPRYAVGLDYRQTWLVAFTDLLCPLLLSCVPILTAAASASFAFVTERERGTLETLLLTSLDAKSVFHAKVTGCTILSVLISAAAFLMFFLTAFIADLFMGTPVFFSLEWLALLVLILPVLSFFSVNFVALIITRVHSTVESLQTMGYLILPVTILYLVQFTGMFRVNFWVLLILALVLGTADIVLFNMAARSFVDRKSVV